MVEPGELDWAVRILAEESVEPWHLANLNSVSQAEHEPKREEWAEDISYTAQIPHYPLSRVDHSLHIRAGPEEAEVLAEG